LRAHGTSSSRFIYARGYHLRNWRWSSHRLCRSRRFRRQDTIGPTREELSSSLRTGSCFGNHSTHIRRWSRRRRRRGRTATAKSPPGTCGGLGLSLGLLLLHLLRPLLGHFGFLGLQQFSRDATGTVLRIEQQFPQLSAEDGRLLLAQERGKIHLRQLGIDGGRRRTVLRHRR